MEKSVGGGEITQSASSQRFWAGRRAVGLGVKPSCLKQ
jgi:hypothetical protein